VQDTRPRLSHPTLQTIANAILVIALLGLALTLAQRTDTHHNHTLDTWPEDHVLLTTPALTQGTRQLQPSLCFVDSEDREALAASLDGHQLELWVASEQDGTERRHQWHLGEAAQRALEPLAEDVSSVEPRAQLLRRNEHLCLDLPSHDASVDEGAEISIHLASTDGAPPSWRDDLKQIELLDSAPISILDKALCVLLLIAMFCKLFAWNITPAPRERPRWHRSDPLAGVLAFMAALIFPAVLLAPLGQSSVALLIRSIAMILCTLGIVYGLAQRSDGTAEHALATVKPVGSVSIVLGLGIGVVLAIVANVILATLGTPQESSAMQEAIRVPGTMIVIAAMACLSPWHEELFFRGYLVSALEHAMGPWGAAAFSAFFFTLIHLPQHLGFLPPLWPILLVALVASVLRVTSRSTTVPFALHLGYNALLVLPVLLM